MADRYSGVVNLYKEKGYTSFSATERVKKIFRVRKAGHGGTLDPEAEGVLPVLLGKATRISSLFLEADKAYRMRVRFGLATDTHDLTGTVLEEISEFSIDKGRLEEVLAGFVGTYEQVPPKFSAVKVGGKRAYDLARQGVDFEIPPKKVTCLEVSLEEFDGREAEIYVRCKAGFYLRAMVRDLGERIGVPAVASNIVREEAGFLKIEDSVRIADIVKLKKEGKLGDVLIDIDEALASFPSINVPEYVEKRVLKGAPPSEYMPLSPPHGFYKIKNEDGRVIAVVKRLETGKYEYVCVLGDY